MKYTKDLRKGKPSLCVFPHAASDCTYRNVNGISLSHTHSVSEHATHVI